MVKARGFGAVWPGAAGFWLLASPLLWADEGSQATGPQRRRELDSALVERAEKVHAEVVAPRLGDLARLWVETKSPRQALEGQLEDLWGKVCERAASETLVGATVGLSERARERLDMALVGYLRPELKELAALAGAAGDLERAQRELLELRETLLADVASGSETGQGRLAKTAVQVWERCALLIALRLRLLDSLVSAAQGGDEARKEVHGILRAAETTRRMRRTRHLEESIKCKCPNEKWSRTLAGCWEPCANPQKEFVALWLDAGLTDAEVLDWMVALAGTKEVLAVEQGVVPFAWPFVALAVAAANVGFFLRRFLRRPAAPGALAPEEVRPAEAELEERVERELKAMED